MAVQADHPIRGRHHHMQIMADHQNRRPRLRPHLFDQTVERRLAGLVKALGRLVQDQDLRV